MNIFTNNSFKRNVTLYVGVSGSLFLMVFGINALLNQQTQLGIILLCLMLIGQFSIAYMLLKDNTLVGQNGVSLVTVILVMYLVFTGGYVGTGPLWVFPLLVIILALQGFKSGLVAHLIIMLTTAFIFFFEPLSAYDYQPEFEVRYLATFLAVSIMALIYEYHRDQADKKNLLINEILKTASTQDPLTNLLNRRAATEELEKMLSLYRRHGTVFSLIMLDLDKFKELNDSYGHTIGDQVLIDIAQLLVKHTRAEDKCVRWGGEEFIIIMSNTNLEEAKTSAEHLRAKLNELNLTDLPDTEKVTASFGVSSIKKQQTLDHLLVEVDNQLYQAKNAGRNQVSAS